MYAVTNGEATTNANPRAYLPPTHPETGRGHGTPPSPDGAVTPYYVGPVRNTFRTPQQRSPLTPRVSQRLLETLALVVMDDSGEPVSPMSPLSESSCNSAATTVSCSIEGSWCVTP